MFNGNVNEDFNDDFEKINSFDYEKSLEIFKRILHKESVSATGGDCWSLAVVLYFELKKEFDQVWLLGAAGPHALAYLPSIDSAVDAEGIYSPEESFYGLRYYKTLKGYVRGLQSSWIAPDQLENVNKVIEHYTK